jgi:hypothetical protein
MVELEKYDPWIVIASDAITPTVPCKAEFGVVTRKSQSNVRSRRQAGAARLEVLSTGQQTQFCTTGHYLTG